MELFRLRMKDVDLAMRQITVRDGKGGKDRLTIKSAGILIHQPLFALTQGLQNILAQVDA